MGQRGRAGAAQRLASALQRGEAPGELRSLLVHGPIAVPSPGEVPPEFDLAKTRPHVRIEAAIANDDDEPTAPVAAGDSITPAPSQDELPVLATPGRGRAKLLVAAGVALLLGGVAAAVLQPQASSIASASSAFSAALAGRVSLDEAPVPLQPLALAPAPAPAPAPVDEPEIIVLDEVDARLRSPRSRRAKAAPRRERPPVAENLARDAASAMRAGDRGDAIELYERALTADPGLGDAAAKLSVAYFDLGRFDLATAWAEHAVKTDFANPEYHVLLGDAYYRNAAQEDARAQWTTAVKLGSARARDRLAKLE